MSKKLLVGIGVVAYCLLFAVWAVNSGVIVPAWNAAYEAQPLNGDPISAGAAQIRTLKGGVAERMAVEHMFGDRADPGANPPQTAAHDDGLHRTGSATSLTSADCSLEVPDALRDDGWLCIETADWTTWAWTTAGGWVRVGGTPTNSIILWDFSDTCPTGYAEATEFRNLTIRGADTASGDADIPDSAGNNCVGDGGGAPCANPAVVGMYDDTITEIQLPGHTHDVNTTNIPGPTDMVQWIAGALGFIVVAPDAATTTGGDDDHYHPFRTVIFCKKS